MSLFSCLSCLSTQSYNSTLLLIGFDNAGKTSVFNTLIQADINTVPTYGFNSKQLSLPNTSDIITLFDVGGGSSIRGYWNRYYHEVHGIILVIDSTDINRMNELSKVFEELKEHQYIKGKPVLIFANKQDLPSASAVSEISTSLRLDHLSGSVQISACTALFSAKDPKLMEGILWLQEKVINDWANLSERVNADKVVQEKIQADEVAATLARVRARKAAEEERIALEEKEKVEQDLKSKELIKPISITPEVNETSELLLPKDNNSPNPIISISDTDNRDEIQLSHPHSLPMTPLNVNKPLLVESHDQKEPEVTPELNSI